MADILISILQQGLIFGIMALGIYISYKILDFPDLSVDGSFPLGTAISARMITMGINPWLALLVAFAAGAAAGCVTGLLNVKLKIKDLLSGILVMLSLYTANYIIAGGPNTFFMGEKTIFSSGVPSIIIIIMITVAVKVLLDMYLATKSGFLLKATGNNQKLVVVLAKDPGTVKILGLAIANALVSFSGAVYAQSTMQFDISSGTGTMVMGLAAVIIGMTIFRKMAFVKATTAVIVGMIIYKGCITVALFLGLPSHFLNLMMAVLFVIPMVLNNFVTGKGTENVRS